MRKMTKRGFIEIEREINYLWNTERPFVVEEVYEAAQLGDRSENAAYIYGKQRMRMIDKRLGQLRRKIKDVEVIDTDEQQCSETVAFGAYVELEDQDEQTRYFRLVDAEESDLQRNRLSVQSPVGSALLGRAEGDDVTIRLPKKTVEYEIITVHYGPDPDGWPPSTPELYVEKEVDLDPNRNR